MNNDEYEIFPQKLLEDLKYDVEALKKKLSEPDTLAQDLMTELEDFRSTIKDLHNVFKEALQDIKEEDSAKLLSSLQHQIETVTTQNETIARGMVAISDKLEDFMKKQSTLPNRAKLMPPAPNSPLSSRIAPPIGMPPSIGMPPPPQDLDIPPPPPGMKSKRAGIFK